jgi:hypothetical protein
MIPHIFGVFRRARSVAPGGFFRGRAQGGATDGRGLNDEVVVFVVDQGAVGGVPAIGSSSSGAPLLDVTCIRMDGGSGEALRLRLLDGRYVKG